jgi:hypothetical protein
MNFKHRKITPLWPQANGGVERSMKTLKKALRCAVAEKRNWKEEIPRFLLNYRTGETFNNMTALISVTSLNSISSDIPFGYLSVHSQVLLFVSSFSKRTYFSHLTGW